MPKLIALLLTLICPIFCSANEGQKLMPLIFQDIIDKGIMIFILISIIILLIPVSNKVKYWTYTLINVSVAGIIFILIILSGDAIIIQSLKILIAPIILNLIFFFKYKKIGAYH